MKTTKYIPLFIASLFLCANAQAQKAKPAQDMNEVFQAANAEQAEANNAAQANAIEKIKELYEGDKITNTTIFANYSNANSQVSISTANSAKTSTNNFFVSVEEGMQVKSNDLIKGLANILDRATQYNEKAVASKAALLAFSLATEAMDKKGTLAASLSGTMSASVDLKQISENVYKAKIDFINGESSASAELDIVKSDKDVYYISGVAGDTSLNVKLTTKDDLYVINGESAGEEVKNTISNKIDLSFKLVSSEIQEKNGNGTIVRSRVATNNDNSTHTITETPISGDPHVTVIDGNTLIPLEEYKVLNRESIQTQL